MKRILSIFLAAVISGMAGANVSAQSGYTVKGVVVDSYGPVIGATVLEEGTSNGVSTGIDGDFSIIVSSGDVKVVVSCIGYVTMTYKASEVPAQIVLAEDNELLSEAVVIGYGSLSKKELSSSIVQVDKKDFFKGSINNPMEMLTGKVAGLNVSTTQAANPNASSDLQIRGATSLSAGNSPLIVIDGVPGGDMRNLSPQDIESMTVLKDAASAAIYGTRGANGVILITTRKGSSDEAGVAHVTYDSYFAINNAKKPLAVLTPEEWVRSRRGNDYGYRTVWYDELLRDFSFDTNQYLSIDGSTSKGSYNGSVNWKKATGVDLVDARQEFGARVAVEQRIIKDIIQLNLSLNGRRVNEVYGDDGQFNNALSLNPTYPVKNADGSWYQPTSPTGARNPVEAMLNKTADGQRLYLMGTAAIKVNILKNESHNLNTTLTYNLNYNDYKTQSYLPSTSGSSYWGGYTGEASMSYSKNWTNQVEWLFNYSMHLGSHHLQAVAGYSYQDSNSEGLNANNKNFAYDSILYNDLGSGTYLKDGLAGMGSSKSISKVIGLFARVNYNWNNIVMASASIRREGATSFGENQKWGNFPAVSVAWEMANMDFMSGANAVNSLKPRVSFGVTGRRGGSNQSRPTYSANGMYFIDGEWIQGYRPANNPNPDLAWEKLMSVNIGVDFAFFNSRLSGSIDLFDRQSRDLLYNYTAPQPPFLYDSILVNVGTTENMGVELSLNADIFKKTAVRWSTGVNASFGSSKIKSLANQMYNASYIDMGAKGGVGSSEYFFRYAEGTRIGEVYGYQAAGVNEAGELLVLDNDGNKVTAASANPAFKRAIGNTSPKVFLSWNNTISYKGFDLNLFFNGAFGYQIFNNRKYGMGLRGLGSDNVYRTAYTVDKDVKTAGGVISSYFLENGDHFKLQSATLGYTFVPKDKQIISNLRVFLSAKNLFTITRYSGSDPAIVGSNGLTPGIDNGGGYPEAYSTTLGLTVTF